MTAPTHGPDPGGATGTNRETEETDPSAMDPEPEFADDQVLRRRVCCQSEPLCPLCPLLPQNASVSLRELRRRGLRANFPEVMGPD